MMMMMGGWMFLFTLIEKTGCMSVHGIQKGTNCITPARDQVIGGHEPERHNSQQDASISCTRWWWMGVVRSDGVHPNTHHKKKRNEGNLLLFD